jgi:hypothetical protein
MSPWRSTRQQAIGSSAGARTGSPVRSAEAGVVPWTPYRVADNQSVDKRTVIVRAMSANGKELVAGASKYHVFAAGRPEHHASIRKSADRNALAEIGQGHFFGISHVNLATLALAADGLRYGKCETRS